MRYPPGSAVGQLHPIVVAASDGRLPDWARVGSSRRAHIASVAKLLARWAAELELSRNDLLRWSAAGWLHDALRDADPRVLAPAAGDYPPAVGHGPAAAARLRVEGVEDDELLEAIAFHSLGRRGLGRLGRFLFLADYLEPLRAYTPADNAALRARLPQDHDRVLRIVCARRIAERLKWEEPVPAETLDFWNDLVGGG